jgi:hypothetical protein
MFERAVIRFVLWAFRRHYSIAALYGWGLAFVWATKGQWGHAFLCSIAALLCAYVTDRLEKLQEPKP